MSIFTKLFSWLKKAGHNIEVEAAKIAVAITEALKMAAANGSLNIIGDIVDFLTKSGVGSVVVEKVKVILPNLMSIALGLESPPEQATAEQIAEWSDEVLKALGISSDKSKFYTIIAADLAKDIQIHLAANGGKDLTFAQWVEIVEDTFKDYKLHEPA